MSLDVCEHGSVRRKCAVCCLEAEVAALQAQRDELIEQLKLTTDALGSSFPESDDEVGLVGYDGPPMSQADAWAQYEAARAVLVKVKS